MRKLLMVVGLLLVAALTMAQAIDPAPPSADQSVAGVMTAVLAAVVPFVVYGIRLVAPRIPRILVPIVTFMVSGGATYLASVTWGGGFSMTKAAVVAGGAWILREIYSTLTEHGVSG